MARRPQLHPAWLVGLLNRWAVRDIKESSRALGWYGTCPMLKSAIPARAISREPVGYSEDDFIALGVALGTLDEMRMLAVMRYFKPWSRKAIDAEVQKDDATWLYHLKTALFQLDERIPRKTLAAKQGFRYKAANLAD